MKAYVISLSNALERRELMKEQIAKISGIKFIFFDAITFTDVRFLKYRKHWDWDCLTRLYRGRALSLGEKACFASHFCLWEQCVKDKEAILILEDDIVFELSFQEKVLSLQERGLDFVRLMPLFEKKSIQVQLDIRETIESICGTQGYFLTPKVAQTFINKTYIWFCPIDNYLDKPYLHGIPNLFFSPPVIRENPILQSCIDSAGDRASKIPFYYKITKEIATCLEGLWRKIYGWKYLKN